MAVSARDSGALGAGSGKPQDAVQFSWCSSSSTGTPLSRRLHLAPPSAGASPVGRVPKLARGHEEKALDVPEPLLAVIDEYARDGYRWFLFDVVDVGKEQAKKTPLRIRFATDHLYYPMRITRTEKGPTTVALSILTNVLFNKEDCIGIPRDAIEVPARPREIPGDKVHFIDPPLFELLGHPKTAMLRSWRISGEIDSFERDLLIRNPAAAKGKGAKD